MKILTCTDGSEESVKAMEKAIKIAAVVAGSEITVIHVMSPCRTFFAAGEVSSELLRQWDCFFIAKKLEGYEGISILMANKLAIGPLPYSFL